jgi:hypothetical protein
MRSNETLALRVKSKHVLLHRITLVQDDLAVPSLPASDKRIWAACRARDRVADGSADEGFITDVLLEAAHHAGLPQLEAQRTIRSGMRGSHD